MRARRWKKRKPLRAMTAVTLLLAGVLLVFWAASMYVLTIVTAQEFYSAIYDENWDYGSSLSLHSFLYQHYSDPYYRYEHPDILERDMMEVIEYSGYRSLYTGGYGFSEEEFRFIRKISIPIETVVLFYDKDGNIIHKSGAFLYFPYYSQEEWDTGADVTSRYGWLDLSGTGEAYSMFYAAGTRTNWDFTVLRITGVMDGTEIKPVALDYLTEEMYRSALDQVGPNEYGIDEYGGEYRSYSYTYSDLDRAGVLEWAALFDYRTEAQEEFVTIYAVSPRLCVYEGSPLTYQGERYDSLLALVDGIDFSKWTEQPYSHYAVSEYSLNRFLSVYGNNYRDWTDYDYSDENVPLPEIDFIMVVGVMCHPLRGAISALRNIYIGTGILALLLVLFLRSKIKKRLIEPLGEIADGMAEGWRFVYTVDNKPDMWQEAEELYGYYQEESDWRRIAKNENVRLNAALEYAKKAEQSRRQMTSSIAHELKTPLAIIHSYSEGLKEHIAEEKREQYLDVILSEAERMDSMVLEMLDLSRLEAGKVKLARDEFSLSALTRAVFGQFAALAEEKALNIKLELEGDCLITADEGRIEQVISNFASNAVRYTPEGGTILVKTIVQRGKTRFSVENTSKPFAQEDLVNVWETFYQIDPSRGGKGTGLGLAIAKNIIDLHGGTCAVRNTDTGIEFSFVL